MSLKEDHAAYISKLRAAGKKIVKYECARIAACWLKRLPRPRENIGIR